MQTSDEQRAFIWWAQGDTPVRNDSHITYLVDGRTAMLTMCRHFIKSSKYIYLANWGITPRMELVRGTDRQAGPDGSPEQAALLAELRAEGFSDADIEFWSTRALSVQSVLQYAVSKGVEVKVLLWSSPELFSHYEPKAAHDQLVEVGVACILDDSAFGIIHHPAESLHQKISIVDGTHAFVGGVDPLIEKNGEYDRWDTPTHFFSHRLRRTPQETSPHPWHDAHALIEGPAVSDVELNFRQRWNDVIHRHHKNSHLLVPEHPLPPPQPTKSLIQVVRTIPQHTYSFGPEGGIQGIAQLYKHALSNIERFVFLENQYLWLRAFTGINISFLGFDSPDMEHNIRKLSEALERGAAMTIILPDHPNVGRAFTDAGLMRLRTNSPQAEEEGRLQAFCLATSIHEGERMHYRPIYVHSKVAIVDDLWSTVGSANLNNRGMRDDTEMNVAALDADLAHGLRLMLQGEHLGLVQEDDLFAISRLLGQQHQSAREKKRALEVQEYLEEKLGDPFVAMRMMHVQAWENLRRYQAHQPLIGHLLPYLTGEEATQQGLNFSEEHGWLEEV